MQLCNSRGPEGIINRQRLVDVKASCSYILFPSRYRATGASGNRDPAMTSLVASDEDAFESPGQDHHI